MSFCFFIRQRLCVLFSTLMLLSISQLQAATLSDKPLLIYADGPTLKIATADYQSVMQIAPGIWGPKWQWHGLTGNYGGDDQKATWKNQSILRGTNAPITFESSISIINPRQFELTMTFISQQETDLTNAIVAINTGPVLAGPQRATIHSAAGSKVMDVPFGRAGLSDALQSFEMKDTQGNRYTIHLDKPIPAGADRQVRLNLASDHIQANTPATITMTVDLPMDATFNLTPESIPAPANWDDWFVWDAKADMSQPSVLDMSSWLDAPAGRYGRVTRDQDKLMYNGKEQKFWGTNVCYSNCFPDQPVAQQKARFYARYGINSVRFHKFADGSTWNGLLSRDSYVQFDPQRADKMDYFVSQLKEQGIFIKLSANFGRARLFADDLARVPYHAELGKMNRGVLDPNGGAIFLSTELQDIQIQQCTNFLKRSNSHTGMTYAKDPVVMVVELINEDSILFYGTMRAMTTSLTLRNRAGETFGKWLRKHYGTAAALQKAWGDAALNSFGQEKLTGEKWDGLIFPAGNPWYYNPDQLDGMMANRKQRLLDTMLFLYEQQNAFYERFVKAIRDTGYDGMILSSNWQAGSGFSHFYNMASDARLDIIDRHNYFGGIGSMLASPGSGCLSSGMQQVADYPFMLSEWITTFPNEFGAEGPAIIGAYGMGLNGWDVSYMFHNGDDGKFRDRLGQKEWDVVAPQIIGMFPAVARQVLRNDVKQSDVVFKRNVHVPSMAQGKLGFDDQIQQGYDVKEFSSRTVPMQTLAIGRSVVQFTDEYQATDSVDISKYNVDGKVLSATGQLAWQPGANVRDGYFTINTPGTAAVVGFTHGQVQQLGPVAIATQTPFAAIYVTALDADADIASGKRLLITAIARVYNTDMKLMAGDLIQAGKGPMRVEPVQATISIKRAGKATVQVLDQDGCMTDRKLPISPAGIDIDTARDKTVYYLVTYN